MTTPSLSRQAHAFEEERILAGLVHHGPLTYSIIRRKVLPNMGYAAVGNAIQRLADRREIETFRVPRGPATWRITDAGRARLKLPPLAGSPVTSGPTRTLSTGAPASSDR